MSSVRYGCDYQRVCTASLSGAEIPDSTYHGFFRFTALTANGFTGSSEDVYKNGASGYVFTFTQQSRKSGLFAPKSQHGYHATY